MDSAEAKFHATVVSLLVFPLVFGVVKLAPLLGSLPWLTLAAGTVATALASAGVYRLLSTVLMHLLRKNERLKRFILGRAYLHGTWVGWFIGHNNDVRYLVEVFEQDLSGVTTRGMSFTEAGEKHGEWSSEATLIDHAHGKFLYTCDVQILRAGVPYRSVAQFTFERKNPNDPPHALDGHVTDVQDGVQLEIRVEKVSCDLLGFRDALPHARAAWQSHVSTITHRVIGTTSSEAAQDPMTGQVDGEMSANQAAQADGSAAA